MDDQALGQDVAVEDEAEGVLVEATDDSAPAQAATAEAATQPLTAEFLKSQIADLKRRVKATRKVKTEDIKKDIHEQQEAIGKDEELLVLVDEALRALNKFERDFRRRVHGEEEYSRQFVELSAMVGSLEKQRDEAIQKFEVVEHQLETEEKTWFKEKAHDAMVELRKDIEKLVKELNAHAGELQTVSQQKQTTWKEFDGAKAKVDLIVNQAAERLASSGGNTSIVLKSLHTHPSYADFLSHLQNHKKTLGWLSFKEKSVISSILAQRPLFAEVDAKHKAYNDEVEKEETLNKKIAEMAAQLRGILAAAQDKQWALNRSFNLDPKDESWGNLHKNALDEIEQGVKDLGLLAKVREQAEHI